MSTGGLGPIAEGVLSAAGEGVAVLADGVFRRANDAYRATFGIDEATGIEGDERADRYDEATERRLVEAVLPELAAGEEWRGDAVGIGTDDDAVPLDLTVRRVDDTHTVHVVRSSTDPDPEARRALDRTSGAAPESGVSDASDAPANATDATPNGAGVTPDGNDSASGGNDIPPAGTDPTADGTALTERKRRERELARYEAIVETMGDGAVIVDADGAFEFVNHRVRDLIEQPEGGFVGTPVAEVLPDLATDDAAVAEFGRLFQELRDGTRERGRMELTLDTREGEMHLDVRLAPVVIGGDIEGIVATTRDVTDRKERERELRESERRYRRLVETAPVPIVILDGDTEIVYANDATAALTGVADPAAMVGRSALEFVHPDEHGPARERIRRVIEDRETPERVERTLVDADGDERYAILANTPVVYDDDPAAQVVLNDVTELKRRERQLAARKSKIERLHEVAADLEACTSPDEVYDLVVATAADILETDRVVAYAADGDGLVSRAADGSGGGERIPTDADDAVARAYRTGEPSAVGDADAGVAEGNGSGPSAFAVPDGEDGVIRADAADAASFDETDLELVELLVAHAGAALARIDRERQLQRERDRLELLVEHLPTPVMYGPTSRDGPIVETVNPAFEAVFGYDEETILGEHLDELIVPDDVDNEPINRRAVEDGSVAAEVRRTTADGVRDFHLQTAIVPRDDPDDDYPYEGWAIYTDVTEQKRRERELRRQRDDLETLNRINELVLEITRSLVDSPGREDVEAAVCGSLVESDLYDLACVLDPPVDGKTLSPNTVRGADASDPGSIPVDPGGLRSSALSTGETAVTTEAPSVPWSDRSYASMAVVPLTDGETIQGLLEVYTDREDAFSDRELAGFRTLGETVGFVFDAIEQRKLLVADSVLELEFAVAEGDLLAALSAAHDCSLSLEGCIDAGANDWQVYVTVEGADCGAVTATATDRDGVEGARTVGDGEGGGMVELTLGGGTFPVDVVEYGVKVSAGGAEGGQARYTAEVPPATDVRGVLTRIKAFYPDATLLSQRERSRTVRTAADLWDRIEDRITDRQLAALRTAFHAGYFDWPRESTAEEVAEAMGISSPTLHSHLRHAQRQLLDVLLDPASREAAVTVT